MAVRKKRIVILCRKPGFFLPLIFISSLLTCIGESPTVIVPPAAGSVAGIDTGILNPMIQRVSPGTLQSLDVPLPSEDGVNPSEPGIVAVFSRAMVNANNEMGSSISLVDSSDPSVNIPVIIKPLSSSTYFTVIPDYASSSGVLKGSLKENTTYLLRIYKTAFADTTGMIVSATVLRNSNVATVTTAANHGLKSSQIVSITGFSGAHAGYNATQVTVTVVNETTFTYANTGANEASAADSTGNVIVFDKTLVFSNLVEPPASTIDPADPLYVEYAFSTGSGVSPATSPFVSYTLPGDGDPSADKDAPGGFDAAKGPYLQIVFENSVIPMIDPSTVNDQSVTLYNDTDGVAVTANSISCYYTDTDFKTFRFYTTGLLSGKHYTFTVGSAGYPVADFSGKSAPSYGIGFTTQ